MTLRILHTADWQIGRRFAGITGDAGALLRNQRIDTVRAIADLAVEREAHAVVVAGDVFEMNEVTDATLRRTFNALAAFKGPWLLLPGNHDAALAESAWTRARRIGVPDNVHLLVTPEPVVLADGQLAVLPAPLNRRHEGRDVSAAFDSMETPDGAIRVGLAHGSVENRLPAGAEIHNPIAEDRALRARLAYLALGDWHGTLNIAPRTWYSGTHEVDRFRDNDAGNVLMVELDNADAEPRVERITTTHYTWHTLHHVLHGAEDADALDSLLRGLPTPNDKCVVRFTLEGTLDLETLAQVNRSLDDWSARVHFLDANAERLRAQPTDEDIDRLAPTGFVRTALERLRAAAGDPASPDAAIAGAALQRLYTELRALRD